MPQKTPDTALSAEQLHAIETFKTDFNAVDKVLRAEVGVSPGESTANVVQQYRKVHPGWRDAERLHEIRELRNVLVHSRTRPNDYLAVPAPHLVNDLRRIREELENPARVLPCFQRKVITVGVEAPLSNVLKLVTENSFSQFPVYREKEFCGLLTENGITRWLAQHTVKVDSMVEFAEAHVEEVLAVQEECQKNCAFVGRTHRIDDVAAMFAEESLLEAVLVTQNGRKNEGLLGIITRWDRPGL